MGQYILDQYSLLHFAVGILAYFWGFSWHITLLLHILFEYIENTPWGIRIINTYLTFWPGGKPRADSIINQVSDTVATMIGWYVSRVADIYGLEHHIYMPA